MKSDFQSAVSRFEETILQFFSPSGLLTVVVMIMLSVLLFSGNGIERRTHDRSAIEVQQQALSPLLATHR